MRIFVTLVGFLFVAKKNGKLRFCVDYRLLNKVTVKNLLDKLHGKKFFTSIDLQSAYHQVQIPKTAFTTSLGLYEFTVLPFGLCNAPSTFQTLMQNLLGHLKSVVVYLDDILIFSDTIEEHNYEIKEVLKLRISNEIDEGDDFFLLAATTIITVADHVLQVVMKISCDLFRSCIRSRQQTRRMFALTHFKLRVFYALRPGFKLPDRAVLEDLF